MRNVTQYMYMGNLSESYLWHFGRKGVYILIFKRYNTNKYIYIYIFIYYNIFIYLYIHVYY